MESENNSIYSKIANEYVHIHVKLNPELTQNERRTIYQKAYRESKKDNTEEIYQISQKINEIIDYIQKVETLKTYKDRLIKLTKDYREIKKEFKKQDINLDI